MGLFDAYAEEHAEVCARIGSSISALREQSGSARKVPVEQNTDVCLPRFCIPVDPNLFHIRKTTLL